MRRSGLTLTVLVIPLLVAGCTAYAYERGTIYEVESLRHQRSRYNHRIDRDAHGYVRHLDSYLHLSRRQERRIYRLLHSRAYDLLERTPGAEHYRVYPFPRNYGRQTQRWWHETDHQIENLLSRRQLRRYHERTRRNDDDRDDRYRDRNARDDRHPRRHDDK